MVSAEEMGKGDEEIEWMLDEGETVLGESPAAVDGVGRHFSLVRQVLGGKPTAATALGIDLNRHHVGLVAWGEDGVAAARGLAGAIERPLLLVPVPSGSWWGWCSAARPLSPEQEERIRGLSPLPGAGLGIGLEGFGEAGFRSSHRQARRARRLAGEGVAYVRYGDVVLEALLTENQADAQAFVASELRGIDDDSVRSRELRETLLAYFACEYNAASTGARLGVHEQTVANRLRAAEERLGHQISARRVELEMALRLHSSWTRI